MHKRLNRANNRGISSLWNHWAISFGAINFIVFISPIVSKVWLPAVVLILELLFVGLLKNKDEKAPVCNLLPFLTTRILFFTAVIMVGINIYYMEFIDPQEYVIGLSNRKIPYISVLVVAPVTFVLSLWIYLRRSRLAFCFQCHIKYGLPAERGFLGRIFSHESIYQIRLMIMLSGAMTLFGWLYYWLFYCNVNLNTPDRFFFVWIPVILYVLSLIYLRLRYMSIYAFYRKNVVGEDNDRGDSTLIRYILLCDDNIFLKVPADELSDEKVDTPAKMYVPYREKVTMYDAEQNFRMLSGLHRKVEIKFLYENFNYYSDSNIFHYACFFSGKSELESSRLKGVWCTQHELHNMMSSNRLTSLMKSEMLRLYNIVVACKTYNRDGCRLYDIKHYKPTFHLHDLNKMDVNFNDPVWLRVVKDNADSHFFKFRKFWRKYVEGFED